MKIFRTLSTGRLIALVVVLVSAVVAGAVAVAARGGGGSTPPPEPLAQAIHDALGAAEPAGVTARISFTNKLFPSGALTGQAGSALMTGATGRLWANATGGRLELQSDAGDAQIVWNDTKVTVYDASSNTAYVADLPQKPAGSGTTAHAAPTLDEITTFLTDLGKHWTVSGADPSNVAGQQAYTVTVSPSHDGGLLGSVRARVGCRARHAAQGCCVRAGLLVAGARARGDRHLVRLRFRLRHRRPAACRREDRRSLVADGEWHGGRQHDGAGDRARSRAGRRAVPGRGARHARRPAAAGCAARRARRRAGRCSSSYGQGLGAIVVVERQAGRRQGGSGRDARRAPVGLSRRRDRARACDAARHGGRLGSRRRRRTSSPGRSRRRLPSPRRARSSERRATARSAQSGQALRRHRRRGPRRPDRRPG